MGRPGSLTQVAYILINPVSWALSYSMSHYRPQMACCRGILHRVAQCGVLWPQLTSGFSSNLNREETLAQVCKWGHQTSWWQNLFPGTQSWQKKELEPERGLSARCALTLLNVSGATVRQVLWMSVCGLLGPTENYCASCLRQVRWGEVATGPIKNPNLEGCFRLKRHVGRNLGLVLSRWRPDMSQPVTGNAGGHGHVCSFHWCDGFTGALIPTPIKFLIIYWMTITPLLSNLHR